MKKRNLLFIFGLFMLVAISGCGLLPGNNNGDDNPDANSDDVEDTPVAQVDDSGQAIIATPVPEDTPIPTNTPLPTALSLAVSTTAPLQSPTPDPDCEYGAAFVSDVTIPDGMNVPMGVNFEKTWRVINTGTCTWEKGSTWIFAGGSQMGADASVSVPTAEPGEVVDITVWFISPTTPGTYRSTWHLKLWHGLELDTLFFVEIVVPLVTPTPIRPTATSSGSGGSGATATPGPSPTPITSPSTWVGKYYNNKELSGDPVFTQNDSALNFDWGTGSPSAEVTADNFSASWIRTIDFSVGTYRFYMFSDDGIRAYINNELIVDEWHDADGFAYYIDITIFAAGSAEFRIEYYENLGDARIEVWWEEIDGFENWRGEYWNNTTLSGSSALVRNDTAINYSWGSDSPAAEINADDFSVRWTRRLSFSEGTYTFRATIDDGMRVYIDDTLVLDEWSANSNRTVTFDVLLTSGEHDIWVEYYELTGEAIAVLTWEQTSGSSTWVGEYWSNADFSGAPAYTVAADEIDFDWRQGSPISGLPADNFSVRWTGQFSFEDGRYTFTARADDGVRVYIDGVLLIDAWNDGSDKAVTADVDLNGLHTILVEYYDVAVSAHVLVSYTKN